MKRQTSRRNFLAEMAAGAVVLPPVLSPSREGRAPALPSLPAAARDEAWWELVRAQFSFTEERVPMNAANLCPSPVRSRRASRS